MEKVFSNLAVLVEKSRKMLKFGISPWRKFENANLLAEDFPLFPCLEVAKSEYAFKNCIYHNLVQYCWLRILREAGKRREFQMTLEKGEKNRKQIEPWVWRNYMTRWEQWEDLIDDNFLYVMDIMLFVLFQDVFISCSILDMLTLVAHQVASLEIRVKLQTAYLFNELRQTNNPIRHLWGRQNLPPKTNIIYNMLFPL